jgi:hypothetical protein
MSFQAYLDTIEERTGLTPRQLLGIAHEHGLDEPPVKAANVIEWFKEDYDLGRGHAMAFVHVLKNGPQIADTHVGTIGTHRDEFNELWLEGMATKPS